MSFGIEGRKYANLGDHGVRAIMPYTSLKAITPAETDLPDGMCRGLWASEACTIDGTTAGGDEVTGIPLLAGENRLAMSIVSAVSTGTVYACY